MTSTAPLQQQFEAAFGLTGSEFVVHAPGRANLIGEHVDYNGLPVLPMALDRGITLMVRARPDAVVRVHNQDDRFGPFQFDMGSEPRPAPQGHWSNYVKAAAQALARLHPGLRGADLLVTSDLPAAAGLSSSSALVVASALALLTANDLAEEPLALAEQMADAERFVGLRGGGMDQAICLAAKAGTASLIYFEPLRIEHRPIPSDWGFVVAFSLVPAEKAAAARTVYNRRTEECRIAVRAVAVRLGLAPDGASYPALLERFAPEELVAAGEACLDSALQGRFRHVITEAARVSRAVAVLEAGDLGQFGALLSASHASLRDDFAVSCEALDALVEAAMAGGAVGARLTGAGLGGSVIALGPRSASEGIMEALDERFYAGRSAAADDRVRFLASPGPGAMVSGPRLRGGA
ncbi:MAG: galactokinase [Gemmatimonadales bacterium]